MGATLPRPGSDDPVRDVEPAGVRGPRWRCAFLRRTADQHQPVLRRCTYLEEHVRHSNALHNHTPEGKAYMVGPLARLNLNHARLHDKAARALKASGVKLPLRNPFMAFFARAIELVEAYDHAIQLIRAYDPQRQPGVEVPGTAAEGCSATEAPRGLLFHHYSVDDQGLILSSQIAPPPTSSKTTWYGAPVGVRHRDEENARASNPGPDQMLAVQSCFLARFLHHGGGELPQVGLHPGKVLRGRRDNLGAQDKALVIDRIMMEEQPARRFGRGAAFAGVRLEFHPARTLGIVVADQPNGMRRRLPPARSRGRRRP